MDGSRETSALAVSVGGQSRGGVTEQVLHRSDVPVFVVPGREESRGTDYERVLVPTDGSENAEVATRHAVAIARRYDSIVRVLTVVDLQAAGGPFDAGGLDREFLDRLESRGRAATERIATEIGDIAPDLGVSTAVERTTAVDGAGAGIRTYVQQNDVDLVVMGSHGRSNLRRQLLGSVASTVLRTVDVPVLVVTRVPSGDG